MLMPTYMNEEKIVEKLNHLLARIDSYDTPQCAIPLAIDSSSFVDFMTCLLLSENNIDFPKQSCNPLNLLIEYELLPSNLINRLVNIRKIRNELAHGVIYDISFDEFYEFKTVMQITSSWLITNSKLFSKYPQFQTTLTEKINNDVDQLLKSQNIIIRSLEERNAFLEKTLAEIIKNQQTMMSKLDEIAMEVKAINTTVNDYQTLIERFIERSNSEEELEVILHLFSEECVKKIETKMEAITTKGQYNSICESLKEVLGADNFNKLDEDSKSFLASSRVMFYNLEKFSESVDYSGVCLLVTKALERVMKQHFYHNLISYCEKRYEISKYPRALLSDSRQSVIKEGEFTLGTVPYVLTAKKYFESDRKIIVAYCKDVLFKNTDEGYIVKELVEIGKAVDNIRFSYRNPSAHVNSINRIKAKECFDYVLDVQKTLRRILNNFK